MALHPANFAAACPRRSGRRPPTARPGPFRTRCRTCRGPSRASLAILTRTIRPPMFPTPAASRGSATRLLWTTAASGRGSRCSMSSAPTRAADWNTFRDRSDEDFAAEMQTPVGPAPMAEFISIRIMDAWVHEQDIRRALDRPWAHGQPGGGPCPGPHPPRHALRRGTPGAGSGRSDSGDRRLRPPRPGGYHRRRRGTWTGAGAGAGEPDGTHRHGRGNVHLPWLRTVGPGRSDPVGADHHRGRCGTGPVHLTANEHNALSGLLANNGGRRRWGATPPRRPFSITPRID